MTRGTHALLALTLLIIAPLARAQDHFTDCQFNTGVDATLIIPGSASLMFDGAPLAPGDEVAAFTPDGLCAGVTLWPADGSNVPMTLWGNNPVTPHVDGFQHGDAIAYRVWSAAAGQEAAPPEGAVEVTYESCEELPPLCRSGGVFEAGTLHFMGSLDATSGVPTSAPEPGQSLGGGASLSRPFPNPARAAAQVSVTISEAGPATLALYDLLGRQVAAVFEGHLSAGSHTVPLAVANLRGGVYIVRLRTAHGSVTRRITVGR